MSAVLSVSDLTVSIRGAPIVDGVNLSIDEGETLALVGESGCGKSMTALAIMQLTPDVATRTAGVVRIADTELTGLPPAAMDKARGALVSMIFQEPVLSLNPLMRVGIQVAEALRAHRNVSRAEARRDVLALFADVGIPNPEVRAGQYPHELSGGMCQRIMIATALICRPRLIIADEPTTALDVTIQAQILDLIRRLREDTGTAVLLITHDMGVVAEVADKVAVMYAGRIVETAPVHALFERQRHPYTSLLLKTIPRLDGPRKTALPAISGRVPDARAWPAGCRFHPRCPLAVDECRAEPPPLVHVAPPDHFAACWRAADVR